MTRIKNRIKLNVVDLSTITYLLVTTILIFSFYSSIKNPIYHIYMRVGFFAILIVANYFRNSYSYGVISLISSIIPLAFLGFFYNETASFNHLFLSNLDEFVSEIEFSIFNIQPSVEFSRVFHWKWFSEIMNFGYFSYYLIITGVPILFYYQKHEYFQKVLFILLSTFYMYYLVFIMIPVVGPQFYFNESMAEFIPQGIFGEIISYIQETGEVPTGAFPSSHVGISILLGYFIFKDFRKYAFSFSLITVLLILSTVYIKAHYVLDVAFAFIITPMFYYLSNKLYISSTNSNHLK